MSETQTIIWAGKSGEKYQHWIYPIGTSFKEVPGNYVFAKETRPGYWVPYYIGQTENLNQRLGDHEKEECAKRNGATHIHTHSNSSGETARRSEEKDLILNYQPSCNEQFVR